jgi:hypothetical protein
MLEEKILNDYKDAMKNRDTLKVSVLSFLRAEFKNAAFEKKKDILDDPDAVTIIRKQIKRRQDSIEQFKQGNRQDLADRETKEMEVLKGYLPRESTPEEITGTVDQVIKDSGALGLKDMGRVMKEVTSKLGASADPKTVSDIVKNKLSNIN